MRIDKLAMGALLLWSCSDRPAPPPLAELKLEPKASVPEVQAPSVPTPAFRPAAGETCTPDYRLVQGVCVHTAYRVDDAVLTQKLAEYKRGAVPPMMGPPPPRAAERETKRELGPGALTVRNPNGGDAGSPKERRIAELDAMISAAKEQLRQRDEASEAKQVNTTHVLTSGDASVAAVVTTTPIPAAAGAATGQDPTAARLAELSQLTQQLSSEQLRALTAQLGSMGMDPNQLQGLLNQAGADSHLERAPGTQP